MNSNKSFSFIINLLLVCALFSGSVVAQTSNNVRMVWSNPERKWVETSVPFAASNTRADLTLTGERFQKWEGFGGCFNELGWSVLSKLDKSEQDKITRELFGTEGFNYNINRLPIGASDFALDWYSLNENDGDYAMRNFSIARDKGNLIPYIKAAQAARGASNAMTLFASPWSPPVWMKQPKAYNYGSLRWEKPVLDAYALYFARFVEEYAKEGININQVHVQNEPNSDQKFPSSKMTGDKMRDFIRDYLAPTFKNRNLKTEIWAGTIEREDFDLWANTILSDPQVYNAVSGLGYQYRGKTQVLRAYESYPEKRLYQTENECGDGTNTWDFAHYVHGLMKFYISSGVNAYVYWNMILQPGGESTWGWKQNSMITIDPTTKQVIYNPEFYTMKHAAHFIKPGATRLGVRGALAGSTLAFENPNGERVLVINNALKQTRGFTFTDGKRTFTARLEPQSFNSFVVPR